MHKRLKSLLPSFFYRKLCVKNTAAECYHHVSSENHTSSEHSSDFIKDLIYNVLSLYLQIQPTPGHRPTEPAPSVLLLYPLRDR